MMNRRANFLLAVRKLVIVSAAAMTGVCLSGCGKKAVTEKSPGQATQEVTQAGTEVAPAASQPAPPSPAPQPDQQPPNLNREVRRWIAKNRRPPKDFDEFANTSGVQIPPPPEGQKYVLDKSMHVILVKR